jgi:hypothetical protein
MKKTGRQSRNVEDRRGESFSHRGFGDVIQFAPPRDPPPMNPLIPSEGAVVQAASKTLDKNSPMGKDRTRPWAAGTTVTTGNYDVIDASEETPAVVQKVLSADDDTATIIRNARDLGFNSDRVIVVPGREESQVDPEKVLDAEKTPVLTQAMFVKVMRYLNGAGLAGASQDLVQTETQNVE